MPDQNDDDDVIDAEWVDSPDDDDEEEPANRRNMPFDVAAWVITISVLAVMVNFVAHTIYVIWNP